MQFPYKNVSIDFREKEEVLVGINKAADAMGVTLGSNGKAVMIQNGFFTPIIADDGATVSKNLKFRNPYWDMGAKLVNERAEYTTREAGDGRATTAVLYQTLANESIKVLKKNKNAGVEINEDLENKKDKIVDFLDKMKIPVLNEDLPRIAEIAALDTEAGAIIAETMIEVGKDGEVKVLESKKPGLFKEVVSGMKLDLGLGHAGMLTDYKKLIAKFENPAVIVVDRKISTNKQITPIVSDLTENEGITDVIIFCDIMEGEALASMLLNRKNGFNGAVVPTHSLGVHKKDILEDICAITGAKLISEELGIKLEHCDASYAGSCESAESGEHTTILIGGKGSKEAIQARIDKVKAQIDATEREVDLKVYKSRLGSLSGGVGVIRYGSPSPEESRKKRYKLEDAVNATKRAMEDGVVPAGGMTLFLLAQRVFSKDIASPIVKKAMEAPFKRMCQNAGLDYRKVLLSHPNLQSSWRNKIRVFFGFSPDTTMITDPALVFDFKLKKWVNSFKVSLFDPMKVTRLAVENAVAGVKSFISSDVFITDEPTDKDEEDDQ